MSYEFPVRQMIHNLKYRQKPYWSQPLAHAAKPAFEELFASFENPCIVPIPMHASSYLTRVENHATLLAKELTRNLCFELQENLLVKYRSTPRQAELNLQQRRNNLKTCFKVADRRSESHDTTSRSRPIILIDDVMTTGSTMRAAALAMKEAGFSRIFGFTIARKDLEH